MSLPTSTLPSPAAKLYPLPAAYAGEKVPVDVVDSAPLAVLCPPPPPPNLPWPPPEEVVAPKQSTVPEQLTTISPCVTGWKTPLVASL